MRLKWRGTFWKGTNRSTRKLNWYRFGYYHRNVSQPLVVRSEAIYLLFAAKVPSVTILAFVRS